MKTKLKNKEKGITLIALVITIILLLILAGVTINIVFNDGLIEKSQKAADEYIAAQQKEEELLGYINKMLITEVNNLNGTENKKMIEDEDYSYYNPVVPVGFKTVNTGDAKWNITEDKTLGYIVSGWNDGLVIEDEDGNQFVWVPVDGTDLKYEKWCEAGYYTYEEVEDAVIIVSDENEQINTYQGFYIARYEAGIPESMTDANNTASEDTRNQSGTPVNKKGQVAWNYIDYTTAQANARSMYNSNEKVKSDLLTGTMWDTVLRWLQKAGVDVTEDSSEWGNYRNNKYGENKVQNTGNHEEYKKKNIYDLAGNLSEWTAEYPTSDSSNRVYRGGYYWDITCSAAYRSYNVTSNANFNIRIPCCTLYSVALNSKKISIKLFK